MVTVKVDFEKCNGDGVCVTVCPVGVFELMKKNGSEKSEPVN
ncbi:MAG: 4Fe-4S binding protein, partial [Candidatus Bathyarchaeota archaeon]